MPMPQNCLGLGFSGADYPRKDRAPVFVPIQLCMMHIKDEALGV
jgi:hypothetical protein